MGKNISMPINLKLTDFNEISTKAFDEVDFDMFILGWGIPRVPTYFKDFWHSSQMAPQKGSMYLDMQILNLMHS